VTRRRRPLAAGLALAALVPLAGCGDDVSAAEEMRQRQVVEIRTAAEDGDVERAREEVAELRLLVEGQVADGEIDDEEAMRVMAAADEVESALGPEPTEATTTTTAATTTTTAPPPPPRGDDKDDDDHKGKGKRGKDRDD
jgi:hypothetical protein